MMLRSKELLDAAEVGQQRSWREGSCPVAAVAGPNTYTPYQSGELAALLYACRLVVHCLPIRGQWLCAGLDATSDLAARMPKSRFMDRSRRALTLAGEVAELGSQASTAVAPSRCSTAEHAGRQRCCITRRLLSSRPQVTDAARMAASQ